jgi:PhnB protein
MKEVFDATQQVLVPREEGIIMHGELRIADAVIMFADVTGEFTAKPAGINDQLTCSHHFENDGVLLSSANLSPIMGVSKGRCNSLAALYTLLMESSQA